MRKLTALIFVFAIATTLLSAQKKILFDNTKSEQAGNADWVIDDNFPTPLPAQSGINASTTQNYWNGGISSWGVEMVKYGYYIETLYNNAITYGNTSNPQDLSNFDVYVVCEPNNLFTNSEKTAIMNFVNAGGGLFMVSDHDISDRDGDGYDSVDAWNGLLNNSTSNPFGFLLDYENISAIPSNNVANLSVDTILHGPAGDVTALEFHNGTTATIYPNVNLNVKALVFQPSYSTAGTTHVMALSSTYGSGRIVFIGDSSPADDGTGNSGDNLYDGWNEANGNDGKFFINATIWLAENTTNSIFENYDKTLDVFPNPCNGVFTATSNQTIELLQVYNNIGQLLISQNQHNLSYSIDISAFDNGFYFVKMQNKSNTIVKKVILNK